MFEQSISVDRMEQAVSLFGSFDENIKMIEKEFDVGVVSRGSEIKVTGEAENVSKGVRAINGLLMLINRGLDNAETFIGTYYAVYVLGFAGARQRGQRGSASADDCGLHLHHFKGQTGQAENARSEEIYRSHPQKYGHSRRRTRWHRQNLSRGRHGGDGFSRKGSQPHNPHPPSS